MAFLGRVSTAKKRLIVAVCAGIVAAFLMFTYAEGLKAEALASQNAAINEYGGERTEVLVATRDILAGEELNADNTAMLPWLSGLLPRGAITDASTAYGRAVSVPVWANEPILEAKIGGGGDLVQVPDGLTAVCIPMSDDMAVGGSLLPGSSVDVYAIGASQVRLVLADVLVLEASNGVGGGQSADSGESTVVLGGSSRASLKWVTLAVADETIPELLSAARDSKLSLVLPGENAGGALAGVEGFEADAAQYANAADNSGEETGE